MAGRPGNPELGTWGRRPWPVWTSSSHYSPHTINGLCRVLLLYFALPRGRRRCIGVQPRLRDGGTGPRRAEPCWCPDRIVHRSPLAAPPSTNPPPPRRSLGKGRVMRRKRNPKRIAAALPRRPLSAPPPFLSAAVAHDHPSPSSSQVSDADHVGDPARNAPLITTARSPGDCRIFVPFCTP